MASVYATIVMSMERFLRLCRFQVMSQKVKNETSDKRLEESAMNRENIQDVVMYNLRRSVEDPRSAGFNLGVAGIANVGRLARKTNDNKHMWQTDK